MLLELKQNKPGYFGKYFALLGGAKKKLPLVICLFIFVSLLDLVGIALIGPFMRVIAGDKSLITNFVDFGIVSSENANNTNMIVGGLAAGILLLFYIKGFVAYYVQRSIIRFGFDQLVRIRKQLMDVYLHLPYVYHIQKNSSEIINLIHIYTETFVRGSLIPSLRVVSEVFMALLVFVLLAYTDFWALASLAIVFTLVFLVYDRVVKNKIQRYGKNSSRLSGEIMKDVTQSIGGVKEVKVLGVEDACQNKFELDVKRHAENTEKFESCLVIPKYLIESAMVTFIVAFAAVSILFGRDLQSLLPVLGIFGAAGVRMMPALNQVFTSINNMRYSSFALNEIYKDYTALCAIPKKRNQFIEKPYMNKTSDNFTITVRDVWYQYPGAKNYSLEGVSLSIHRGQSIGIIGASGAGKSTLIDVLLGLLKPDRGEVSYNRCPSTQSTKNWLEMVAYIPQKIFILDDSLLQNVAFGIEKSEINHEKVKKSIQMASLDSVLKNLPEGINTLLGESGVKLSGGQRQRVALARAFYHDRDILVMDEATSSLDNETEKEVVDTIRRFKHQKTLIVIAHRLSTIENCDLIYRMESGKIISCGSYKEVVGV